MSPNVQTFTAAFLMLASTATSNLELKRGSLRAKAIDAATFHSELRNAMGEAMGCGGELGESEIAAIRREILPMWQTLPKSASGRVEGRSLRFLAHRYFNRRSALVVRGFEPSRATGSSDRWGNADILSQKVPAYVESVLESRHAREHGFDLSDAVSMVATLEQLIFDSESSALEAVYHSQHKPLQRGLSRKGLEQVLENYMVSWLLGDDTDGLSAQELLANRTLIAEILPHWDQVVDFTKGQIAAKDFQRQREPQLSKRPKDNAFSERYSFDDAHEVVGGITRSFASFWQSECNAMKDALVQMDTHSTGRVPLSKFYSSSLESEWRFSESEAYLRDLGALDETSAWRGKQVIIPNYLQASSNCIVSAPHYMVCCMNDCESLLGEIEVAVAAPTATPERLLDVVRNLTGQTTLDDDQPSKLQGSFARQLEEIAAAHGGKVPLHSRLFAQWLHYAFPRECPFPHKAGTATSATPAEYGDNFVATEEEKMVHSSTVNDTDALLAQPLVKEDLQWMSQWSSEEELLLDYAEELQLHGSGSWRSSLGALMLALAGAGIGLKKAKAGAGFRPGSEGLLPTRGKAHFI